MVDPPTATVDPIASTKASKSKQRETREVTKRMEPWVHRQPFVATVWKFCLNDLQEAHISKKCMVEMEV